MRKTGIVYWTVTAFAVLTIAKFSVASDAQAMPLAAPSGVNAAIREAAVAQKVPYVCRHTSNGRECFYTPPPSRQPNSNGDTPYFQKRYSGPSQYQTNPWGNPYGSR
jgi:hypothetical protein